METLLGKIKEKGYWKVVIRPTEFSEKRIVSKEDAEKIITDSKIVLRGWDYPHIDYPNGIVRSGLDSIASSVDWKEGSKFEFWKFYLNGQFVHYFAMREDYEMDEEQKKKARQSFVFSKLDENTDRFFSVLNTLYSVTEIYLFASKLAKQGNFGEKMEIVIELGNTKGRTLFFWGNTFRELFNANTCAYEPIVNERVLKTEELIKNPGSFALDVTIDIFKEFNWRDPNKNVFLEDQIKFMGGRI